MSGAKRFFTRALYLWKPDALCTPSDRYNLPQSLSGLRTVPLRAPPSLLQLLHTIPWGDYK